MLADSPFGHPAQAVRLFGKEGFLYFPRIDGVGFLLALCGLIGYEPGESEEEFHFPEFSDPRLVGMTFCLEPHSD